MLLQRQRAFAISAFALSSGVCFSYQSGEWSRLLGNLQDPKHPHRDLQPLPEVGAAAERHAVPWLQKGKGCTFTKKCFLPPRKNHMGKTSLLMTPGLVLLVHGPKPLPVFYFPQLLSATCSRTSPLLSQPSHGRNPAPLLHQLLLNLLDA